MHAEYPILSVEEFWRRYDALETRLTAPLSERMLDLAGLRPGMRVLDLATGRGEPALGAARRVGPQGRVVAVELASAVLQMARDKARGEGLTNLDFRCAKAESVEGLEEAHFHAATIRWGLMYMTSPVAALATARRALLPTGALVAALWAEPERVPYFTLPRVLLERYRVLPALDPEAPGTFRYASLERTRRDFALAGFTLDCVEEMDVTVFEASDSAAVMTWLLDLGLGPMLNGLPQSDRQAWGRDCTAELERLRSGGLIRLGGVTRIVRARAAK
jgi:ubiquinone/menaquinone biosynthesis C-methylase UbiE